ncbi:MAG: GAF domain-containing protein, partial [Candidatus Promineifilaceae bacterium]|nr:GAF domain-containing protein [Candidatus Promineifilaceae bacterium]
MQRHYDSGEDASEYSVPADQSDDNLVVPIDQELAAPDLAPSDLTPVLKTKSALELIRCLVQAEDLEALGRQSLDGVAALLGAERAAVLLVQKDGALDFLAVQHLEADFLGAVWQAVQENDAEGLLLSRQPQDSALSAAAARGKLGTLACWPLTRQGRLLGALVAGDQRASSFDSEALRLVEMIVEPLSLAIDHQLAQQTLNAIQREVEQQVEKRLTLFKEQLARRKQVEEALRKESARAHLLQQVAVTANETRTADEALPRALTQIAQHLGWPFGHIYAMSSQEDGRLVSADVWYCSDEDRFAPLIQVTRSRSFAVGEGWLGTAAEAGTPTWSTDLSEDPLFLRQQQDKDLAVKAGFALPVMVEGQVAAVLEFFSSDEIGVDPEFLDMMSHIATQLGRTIERQRAMEQLRREEMLLAQAERIAHLGSWQWDLRSSSVTWSEELCRIYGLEPAQAESSFTAFLERIHPEERQRIREAIEDSVRHKRSFQFHHRIVRPNGQIRVLFGQGRPELDDDGNIVQYFGTGQDVTEQVRLQEKLVRQTEVLQTLEEMGHAVTSTFDRQAIFDEVLAKLTDLLGAQGVFVLLQQGEDLLFAAGSGNRPHDTINRRVPATSGVAGEVLASGEGRALFGEEASKRAFEDLIRAVGYRPGALLVAPLRLRGTIIGVLEALHQQADGFNADDLPVLEAAASWTAIAIQNARLFGQLRTSRERLRHLARRVVSTQERERRRISQELHDEAGQALTALKINLDMIRAALPDELSDLGERLDEAIHTSEQTMRQIQRLVHGLHPPILDRFGLGPATEALCEKMARRTDMAIQVDIHPLPPLGDQAAIS